MRKIEAGTISAFRASQAPVIPVAAEKLKAIRELHADLEFTLWDPRRTEESRAEAKRELASLEAEIARLRGLLDRGVFYDPEF